MTNIVKINFKSEKTPDAVYDIFLSDMKEAIALNAQDKKALEKIRLNLLEELAYVEVLQYRLQKVA